MKEISKLTQVVSSAHRSEGLRQNANSEKAWTKDDQLRDAPQKIADSAIVRLFKNMAMSMGHKWTSQFGDAVNQDGQLTETAKHWESQLGDLTLDEIAKGLSAVPDQPSDWWPTVNGFKELCTGKSINKFGLDYVPEVYRTTAPHSRRLDNDEAKDRRRIACDSAMPEIRKLLGRI